MIHSQPQMVLLDQTKTLTECASQLVYSTKEGGGNPKVNFFAHKILKIVFYKLLIFF